MSDDSGALPREREPGSSDGRATSRAGRPVRSQARGGGRTGAAPGRRDAGASTNAATHRPRGLERPRVVEPELPDDVTGRELDREVRQELLTLSKDNAEGVARHLVMAGLLLEVDPERAHQHALAAQRRAGRVGAVREAAGLTAYAAGRHDEALRELRAARRITGSSVHLPVMADAERGLGRPERALALAASAEVAGLDPQGRAEMRIVASGARADLGQLDAAVVELAAPELASSGRAQPWHARTYSAYADALRAAGRGPEAAAWDRRARALDPDAASRAEPARVAPAPEAEVVVYDVHSGDEPEGAPPPSAPAGEARRSVRP